MAWAVAIKGIILETTIFSHPRGAMVNYLYTNRIVGIPHGMPDEDIRTMFCNMANSDTELVEVQITKIRVADPLTVDLV